jgi:hypothetical protein
MRLNKPRSKPSRRADSGRSTALAGTLRRVATEGRRTAAELLAIAREMLRIPAGFYMRAAEIAGAATLAAWRVIWPVLKALWRQAVRLFRVAEREVTPLRAALAVAAVVALALAVSQFADYRNITIGTSQYVGVDEVAPAPEAPGETHSAGSAHAWLGLPLALAALVVVFACARGNRRAAWWLAPIGLVTIVISLVVDAPKGLDEGSAAIAYEGAEASLLSGFWVQLACGALLVALAPLIAGLQTGGAGRDLIAGWRRRLPFGRVPAGEAGG